MTPVLVLALLGGQSVVERTTPRSQVAPGPVALPNGSIIANGTKVTLTEAEAEAPFAIYRPQHDLASDSSLTAVWLSSDPSQVGLQYGSGIRVYVHKSELGDPELFYEGQISTGTKGSIETINGVPAFVVPQDPTEGTLGNVDMVIEGLEVTIIGDGDFTADELRAVAKSVSK